ncbi:MAG: glycosyltransferase family 9 protein [Deltaproteobacteria bacterium]|nr:glycosyltransferase family 9 protein [Deltaproteobacteria bacterium]
MNVLIIRSGALGDTLMLMPAIAQLKGKARITLVGRSPGIDFLRPHVARCMDFESRGWHTLFLDPSESGFRPPVSHIDVAVAFSADIEKNLQRNLQTLFPNSDVHVFGPFPAVGLNSHAALYIARCLQAAGLPLDAIASIEAAQRQPLLASPETEEEREMRIVFHPGSGSAKKNYSPAFWIALLNALQKELYLQPGAFSLLLGPAEEDVQSTYERHAKDGTLEIMFSLQKEALTSLFRKASLYIGLDSGISHLAAMCGTPSIALFKSTSVSQWRPLGPCVRVINAEKEDPSLVDRVVREACALITHKPEIS